MLKGFDCFSPVTAEVAERAVMAGFEFVCRYYGPVGSRKLLLPPEVAILRSIGLGILPVFERSPGRPLDGSPAGIEDVESALHQAQVVGQPQGTTICFAIDVDVDCSRSVIAGMLTKYFTEIATVLKDKYLVGAYGSGDVLNLLLSNNLIQVAWLAGAVGWHGSRLFDAQARWHLKQGPTITAGAVGNKLGIDYDPNEAVSWEKIGAWNPVHPLKPPMPKPIEPSSTGSIDLFELQRKLKAEGLYAPEVDGIVTANGATVRGLVAYSAKHKPIVSS